MPTSTNPSLPHKPTPDLFGAADHTPPDHPAPTLVTIAIAVVDHWIARRTYPQRDDYATVAAAAQAAPQLPLPQLPCQLASALLINVPDLTARFDGDLNATVPPHLLYATTVEMCDRLAHLGIGQLLLSFSDGDQMLAVALLAQQGPAGPHDHDTNDDGDDALRPQLTSATRTSVATAVIRAWWDTDRYLDPRHDEGDMQDVVVDAVEGRTFTLNEVRLFADALVRSCWKPFDANDPLDEAELLTEVLAYADEFRELTLVGLLRQISDDDLDDAVAVCSWDLERRLEAYEDALEEQRASYEEDAATG